MSHHAKNWLKLVSLGAVAFVLALFFSGLLNIPQASLAQGFGGGPREATITQVSAPHLPAARPLAELSDAFASVSQAVRPSVVLIQSRRIESGTPQQAVPEGLQQVLPKGFEPLFGQPEGGNGADTRRLERSSGSGFIVSSNGYILTNNHVIAGATSVTVSLLDGRIFDAKVVGSDSLTDVAVLQIDADNLHPAALGQSSKVRVGEWVLAIGNPLGSQLTFSVTQGIVSAKGRPLAGLNNGNANIQDFIQTDAAINRGNSGGPLVNVRGEVIGINSAIASETGSYAGYAFAVPIDLARAVMNQIIEHGKVQRTAMKVYVRTVTDEDALYLGLDSVAGVKIDDYSDDDSPAKRAGIKPGDVITAVDGVTITYVAQLQQVVGFRTPGETVRVDVIGQNGHKQYTVRLAGVDDASGANDAGKDDSPAPERRVNPETDNALGAHVEPITEDLAREMRIPDNVAGLLVRDLSLRATSIDHLCPLEGCAGPSRAPDVINAIEGKAVRTKEDFKAALAKGGRHGIITLNVVPANGGRPRIERIRLAPQK